MRARTRRSDGADLEAEVAQQAADVVLDGDRLLLQELARRQQRAPVLAGSVFTWTGRNRLTRIIWAMPRASLRSVLFI